MISGPDFQALQKLLQDRAGMSLTSDKLYLVGSRLQPVAQKLGLRSVIELLTEIRTRPREHMITAVIEAMVTHESLFFRDEKPFEQLASVVLPNLARARAAQKTIRVWCAACSSGQEPYSIAIQMLESFPHLIGWRLEIVGTDISDPILEKARAGIYTSFEVKRGLTPARLDRHFVKRADDTYAVSDAVRRMVTFRRHNLIETAAHLGVFDVVFLRNVLIYFETPTKTRVLDHIAQVMARDGALFLGSADTIIGVTSKFTGAPSERGLYRLAAGAGNAPRAA